MRNSARRRQWLAGLGVVFLLLSQGPAAGQTFPDEAGQLLYSIDDNGIVSMFENSPGTDVTLSQSPEQFAAFLNEDAKFWVKLVKDAGVKLE